MDGRDWYSARFTGVTLRCAGALILDDAGRIFVQRRSPDRRLFPGCWDIVGGHVEGGETVYEALRREVAEETGWQVAMVLAELGEIGYQGDDGLDRVEEDFLVRVDGDLDRPRLEPGKHTEYAWITEEEVELLDENRGPGDVLARRILEKGFAVARGLGLVE
jgi:8-oxo-dGTP diphosphatase